MTDGMIGHRVAGSEVAIGQAEQLASNNHTFLSGLALIPQQPVFADPFFWLTPYPRIFMKLLGDVVLFNLLKTEWKALHSLPGLTCVPVSRRLCP